MTLMSLPSQQHAERLNPHQLRHLNEELVLMNQQLYERNRQIEQELYNARQLQQSLLPACLRTPGYEGLTRCHYQDDNVRITGVYLPCDSVGGDIYDVVRFKPTEPSIGVALADVSGHGLPASFITAIFKSCFYRTTHSHEHPGDVLYHINNDLVDMVKNGDYVTALYCRLVDFGQTLEYAGAGHPYPCHYQAETGRIQTLEENGTPLVWMKDMVYQTGYVQLKPGDKVLAYTDGVTEMHNLRAELFGENRLVASFRHALTLPDLPLLDIILQDLSDFTQGEPLHDDLSMVLIERL